MSDAHGQRFHPEKLAHNPATIGFIIDLAMVALVIINLSLIIFDWLFSSETVRHGLAFLSEDFVYLYASTIHQDFIFYDMLFVSVYLTEFSIRWAIAVWRKTYHKWFFYPFIHWYDLLGCIPVGSFRWLRILRVISILARLQKMGIVELQETSAGRFVIKYYRVVIEEISDRVVLNVLEGVQRETLQGNPLLQRIETRVLAPRKEELVNLAVESIQQTSQSTWEENRSDLQRYLQNLSDRVLRDSSAGASIAAIPLAGPRILTTLDKQLSNILLAVLDEIAADISNIESRSSIDKIINSLINNAGQEDQRVNQLIKHLVIDIIEEVKAQVNVQQWKVEEEQLAYR